MKKFYLMVIVAVLTFGYINTVISAELASRTPQTRNVVLEEFTGIHCGYCPDGHKRANELAAANPGKVVLINIHAGSFAVPGAGEPDFRTQWGEAIDDLAKVTGYPAGSVNRMTFPGSSSVGPYYPQTVGGTAMSRSGWAYAAKDSVLNGAISPVNIGAKTKWTNSSRELEIEVELYFTEQTMFSSKLNVVFLESHVWGPQSGAPDTKNYEHNHILRDMVTGQWGETIAATNKGEAITKTYKYTVSDKFKIENCDVAIFITRGDNQYVFTGIKVPAITPDATVSTTGAVVAAKKTDVPFEKTFSLKNTSERSINFVYEIKKSTRTPQDWNAKLMNSSDKVTLAAGENADIQISLTPGSTLGIGDAVLTISEENNPDALSYSSQITVVSADAKYLEVNAGASMEAVVKAGGRSSIVSLAAKDYSTLKSELSPSVVIWNCGPKGGLEIADATAINDMITKGVGVLINGSVPLPMLSFAQATHPLFATLGVSWKQGDDIQLSTFAIGGVAGDPVADGFSATGCTTGNNGYFPQPMTITNTAKTTPMIKCTDVDKPMSVRVVNGNTRTIYLSFNLDIITDATAKQNLIKKAIDWIEATTDVDDETGSVNISVYPNPAADFINVTGINANAEITNIFGQKVWTGMITDGTNIPLNGLSSGVYMINTGSNVYKFVKE